MLVFRLLRRHPNHAAPTIAGAQPPFATAAAIGTPLAESDESRRFDEALDCGFGSSAAIGVLGDAQDKGKEIKVHLS